MVRCVFPPNTQSRHAVVHMKLSMTEEKFASKFYEIFDIGATGGVITTTLSVWILDRYPLTNTPGATALITGTANRDSARSFSGIYELVDISEQQFALCPNCNHQGVADAVTLQHVRTRCVDVRRLCIGCLQQRGYPSDVDEVTLLGDVQVQAIRG